MNVTVTIKGTLFAHKDDKVPLKSIKRHGSPLWFLPESGENRIELFASQGEGGGFQICTRAGIRALTKIKRKSQKKDVAKDGAKEWQRSQSEPRTLNGTPPKSRTHHGFVKELGLGDVTPAIGA